MSLADKSTPVDDKTNAESKSKTKNSQASEHPHDDHGHEHEHDAPHHDNDPETPAKTRKDLFELVRNYQGDRFKPVDSDTRKLFYQSMVGQSFRVEKSDFISLDNSQFEFHFIPERPSQHHEQEHEHNHNHGHDQENDCDLNIIITHPKRNSIPFTAFDRSELTFLSENNFVIKSFVKLNDDKVNSKFYAMTISVVEIQPDSQYVFSFSYTNLEDDDEKIRVYVNHKQPATAGVGRE